MSLKIFELDPAKFPLPPGLPWQTALKMIKVELQLLTDFDLLLMVEKKLEKKYITLLINMQKLIMNI